MSHSGIKDSILFADKNTTSHLIQNSLLPELCLWMVFWGCEMAMSSAIIPLSSVLFCVLASLGGKWEGTCLPIWHGDWWSLVVSAATPVNHLALSALCVENAQGQPVLGVCCWVLCGPSHCTVLWHWRPGSVFPHQPCQDHPPHSSSCPGVQLGISTPNGSCSLVSQGIKTGAGIASLCGHSMSPQRLLIHFSSTAGDFMNWECGGTYHIFPAALDFNSDTKKNPRVPLISCFVGQGGGGLLVYLARGRKRCCSRNLGKANNP